MTFDALFKREFNELMNALASNAPASLEDVPLPPVKFEVVDFNGILIKDIPQEVEYYNSLNNLTGVLYKDDVRRRKFDYLGEFMYDADLNYIYEDISVPQDSVAIVTGKNINIPLDSDKYEGFKYVDYIGEDEGRGYIYIVPKVNVFKLERTALVISFSRQTRFYSGLRIATAFGKYLYLQIIPKTNQKSYETYKTVSAKYSIHYEKEIKALSEFWLANKFIFRGSDCAFEDPSAFSVPNLAVQELDPTITEFEPVSETSLGESNDESMEEYTEIQVDET